MRKSAAIRAVAVMVADSAGMGSGSLASAAGCRHSLIHHPRW